MKKIVKISAVLFAIAFAFSCSNNAGGGNTPLIPSGPEIIEFGTWPQTIKADSVNVYEDTAEQKVVGMFTYYKGSDDEWYCKALENARYDMEHYKYSDGTQAAEIFAGSYKWFKVEPIKWRVLTDNYRGNKLLFCESGIYSGVCYYDQYNVNRDIGGNIVHPSNYMHSRIRAWLNGLEFQLGDTTNSDHKNKGFLQTAFTDEEIKKIANTTIDNSATSTNPEKHPILWGNGKNPFVCIDTTDKIFFLSEKEVTTSEYGFKDYDETDFMRIRKLTDFAVVNGADLNSDDSGAPFLLRSPYYNRNESVLYVGGGAASHGYCSRVDYMHECIVPALCIAP